MAVVYDARLGGHGRDADRHRVAAAAPPRRRRPADGPAQWSAGTLFPLSSKKVARAINAASGCRPVVCWPTCPGFDGSPESLRRLQLEYGAEIGRAIVNFDGPFVLCVVSRYHGGAFVVFSATLNDDMEVLAVEGSFASVIGGAPAAAVVFTREVDERTRADERVRALEAAVADADAGRGRRRQAELAATREAVRTEKLGEVAAEFDAVHSVAAGPGRRLGAPHHRRRSACARSSIAAVERGMAVAVRLPAMDVGIQTIFASHGWRRHHRCPGVRRGHAARAARRRPRLRRRVGRRAPLLRLLVLPGQRRVAVVHRRAQPSASTSARRR